MAARTLDEREEARDIRAWAAEHWKGKPLAAGGRIPAAVKAAYAEATGQPPPDDDPGEPDWDAAELAPPAEVSEPGSATSPGEEGRAAPPPAPHPREPERPAPVRSLEEARDRRGGAAKRRAPPWAGGDRKARTPKKAPEPVKVTPELTADISGKLAFLLAPVGMAWAAADPYCGGAFADNLDTIVRKSVPLICQSPELVAFFRKTTLIMMIWELGVAMQPVAEAAWHHHVRQDRAVLSDGSVVPARRDPATGLTVPLAPPPNGQVPQPQRTEYPPMAAAGHVPAPQPR